MTIAAPASATEGTGYAVRSWTIDDGLPTSTVVDIARTPDGYLWVSTTGGLARFDGLRFQVFGPSDGLPSSRFSGLRVLRDGSLVAATDDGWLCRWNGSRFHALRTGLRLGRASMLEAPDGSIVGNSEGTLWRVRGSRVEEYPDSTDGFSTLATDGHGTIGVTLRGQRPALLRVDGIEVLGPGAPGLGRWVAQPDPGRLYFFRSLGGDAELRDVRMRTIARLPGAGEDWPQLIDARGRLWCSSGPDIVVRDTVSGRELERFRLGLADQAFAMHLDPDGGLWVCTLREGLVRVIPSPVRVLRPPQEPRAVEVSFVRERDDGVVLATSASGGRWRAEADRLAPLAAEPAPWEGTRRARWRLDRDALELRDGSGSGGRVALDPFAAREVLVDPVHPGSVLVQRRHSIVRLTAGPGGVREQVVLASPHEVRDFHFDRSGRLWVATMVGLWRIGPRDTTCFTREHGLPVDHIRQIHEDADGTMWFGSYGGGLVRMRSGRFAALGREQGLLENVVSVVLDDGLGDLWLAGNLGIQRLSKAQAHQCLDGARTRVDVVGYGRNSGMRQPEGSGMPGVRTRDGRLWFPTFDGVAVVDPTLARRLLRSPPFAHVERVWAGDRVVAPERGRHVLTPDERRLEVHYTGIDLHASDQVRFRHRLDGVDRDWVDAGARRTATYTNVPPGRHTFHLRAINGAGTPGLSDASVVIEVRPWFWETHGFLAAAVVMVAGGAFAGARWRDRRQRQRARELQRAVDERTLEVAEQKAHTEAALAEVAAQAEQLKVLDRTRSRFFANISHEFRTPLTLIHGPLQDLRTGAHGDLTSCARDAIDVAAESATRLHRLVDQLLDAARSEAGELRISPRAGDLRALLERLAQAFAPLAARKRLTFEHHLPPAPLRAVFDSDALEKVFANLLGNAVKFTPPGGRVRFAARCEASDPVTVTVTVTDDGPGIAAEDLPHVFELFYRAEHSAVRLQPGTGLGLAIAADLVHRHGGTITAESREGHGSTFTVRLTLATPGDADPPPPETPPTLDPAVLAALADEIRAVEDPGPREPDPAPARHQGAPMVLVVDDHARVREYLAWHLGRHYRVVEAADGEQALAAMRREPPDLVVSDVGMPRMDGHALVRAIRADPELDFVPVLLLTAAASHDSRIAGLEGGADDYLTKPFDMRELAARVAQALDSRRRLRDRVARAAATAVMFGTPDPAPAASIPGPAPATGAAGPAHLRTAADHAFLHRAREVIEARMGEEDFDVDSLVEAIGVGRTLCFEKIRELLGETPMSLVMSHRLERAAQLLRAGEGNVGEVAYAVGFRSVSHFTRRFRERFGTTPSAWKRGEDGTAASS